MKDKIIKLLKLTTSSNDNEALSAMRMANQILLKNSLSWDNVLSFNVQQQHQSYYSNVTAPNENFEFWFGKYRGRTIGEIYSIDIDYLRWVSMNFSNEKVRRRVNEFLDFMAFR